jgi:acyl-coenzyme A thioesterase 9
LAKRASEFNIASHLINFTTQFNKLTMMSKSQKATSIIASLRRPHVVRSLGPALAKSTANSFHSSAAKQTDGVFQGLEDKRQPMPWIEAFTRQQKGLPAHGSSDTAKERDLTPKKMSDSYHRVVLPLKKDPWLSDTYVNSSGHIR